MLLQSLHRNFTQLCKAAKTSQLTAAGWYGDTKKFEDRDDDNKGFTKRKELASESKNIKMMGKLHCDLLTR